MESGIDLWVTPRFILKLFNKKCLTLGSGEMKTVVINECENRIVTKNYTLNLTRVPAKSCYGCWTCWLKTPGRCVYKDLDGFYHEYITADRAIYFAKVTKGFVSSNLKTLFDRMLPLYMPHISVKTDECMHVPRYDRYPDIEFYYEGSFETEQGREIFEAYNRRVFYQFHSKNIVIKPIEQYWEKEEVQ